MLAEGTKVPPDGGQQNICETCSSQTIEQDGGRIDRGKPPLSCGQFASNRCEAEVGSKRPQRDNATLLDAPAGRGLRVLSFCAPPVSFARSRGGIFNAGREPNIEQTSERARPPLACRQLGPHHDNHGPGNRRCLKAGHAGPDARVHFLGPIPSRRCRRCVKPVPGRSGNGPRAGLGHDILQIILGKHGRAGSTIPRRWVLIVLKCGLLSRGRVNCMDVVFL